MFDIVWTDPTKETVAQARARRDNDKGKAPEDTSSTVSQPRRPESAPRRSNSVRDKLPGIFSRSQRKASNANSKSSEHSTPSNEVKQSRESGSSSSAATPQTSERRKTADKRRSDIFSSSRNNSQDRSSRGFFDSLFSRWNDPFERTEGSVSGTSATVSAPGSSSGVPAEDLSPSVTKALKPLSIPVAGPSSLNSIPTTSKAQQRSPEAGMIQAVSDISISAKPRSQISNISPDQQTIATAPPAQGRPSKATTSTGAREQSSGSRALPPSHSGSSLATLRLRRPVQPVPSSTPQTQFRAHDPGLWRPSGTWDNARPEEPSSAISEQLFEPVGSGSDGNSMSLIALMRQLRRLSGASPRTIIGKLTQGWADSNDPEEYKNVEIQKTRWMLTAVYNMDDLSASEEFNKLRVNTTTESRDVLALHETLGVASYLAVVFHDRRVFHIGAASLPPDMYPHVVAMNDTGVVNMARRGLLPFRRASLAAVHCLSMATTTTAQLLPLLLQNIHQSLVKGGTLFVPLINAAPMSETLGPRMRAWLEENLYPELDDRALCRDPRNVIPKLMVNGRLRGPGSVMLSYKFHAIPITLENDPSSAQGQSDRVLTMEKLRSLVGRMLWKEVWGSSVRGTTWWWEDPDCVQECLAMVTTWEYVVIKGVVQH